MDKFFPIELREAKTQEFMNLRQGNMTVQYYGIKFNQLSRDSPHMVADSRAQMNKFLYGVSSLVKKEYRNAMLLGDMNISRLMTHAHKVEDDKLREHAKENNKARSGNYEYSQQEKNDVWMWLVWSQVDGLSFLDRVKEAVMIELSLQIQQYQQVTPLSRVTHLVKVAVSDKTDFMLFRLTRIRKVLLM